MDWERYYSNYQKKCQPYKCPVRPDGYPDPKTCYNPYGKREFDSKDCRPFGYQPMRHNPGGLKFYVYNYNYQTQGGKPLSHPGMGWYRYEKTGEYNDWW